MARHRPPSRKAGTLLSRLFGRSWNKVGQERKGKERIGERKREGTQKAEYEKGLGLGLGKVLT